tara:strand:- start:493 stop:804 length:312 start_codon:yes stop_codon:yes gene_type:complete
MAARTNNVALCRESAKRSSARATSGSTKPTIDLTAATDSSRKNNSAKECTDHVHQYERRTAVFTGHIGEAPDVTELYRKPGRRHEKPKTGLKETFPYLYEATG